MNHTAMLRLCSLLLVFLVALGGCVTASKRPGTAEIDQMIEVAGVTDAKVKKIIVKYFTQMKKEKALALNPFDTSSYHWSQSYRRLDDAKKKVGSQTSKVLFAVNDQFVWEEELAKYMSSPMGIGREAYEEGRYEDAIEQFKLSLQQDGSNWYVYNRLGWAYASQGSNAEAAENFKKSLGLKTSDYSRIGLADCLLVDGEIEAAQEELKKVSSQRSGGEKYEYNHTLAMIHAANGEYAKVLDVLGSSSSIGVRHVVCKDGYRLVRVYQGSPAHFAGLEVGDVILRYGDVELKGKTLNFLHREARNWKPGSTSSVLFVRDGKVFRTRIINSFTLTMKADAAKLQGIEPQGDWVQ